MAGQQHTKRFESLSNVYRVTFLEAEGWTVDVSDTRLDGSTIDNNSRSVHPESGDSTSRHVLVAT